MRRDRGSRIAAGSRRGPGARLASHPRRMAELPIPVARRSRLSPWPITALAALLLGPAACSLPHWPVEGPVTSPFGVRVDGLEPRVHRGVDISVPVGTPVRAMKGGRVTHAGRMGGFGIAVILDHGGGTHSIYAHLSEPRVRAGDAVDGQQVVGLSGQSGNVTGPHLHFEVWRSGRPEDPVALLGRTP